MHYFTIGKLARQAAVAPETIRYYEKSRLLPPPDRLESGYRVYDSSTVKRVRFIKEAQALGFTLAEIADLLGMTEDEGADCATVNAKAQEKLEEIQKKIGTLRKMQKGLEVLAQRCPADEQPLSECSIISHLYGAEE
ncbi:Hg(II)-responsive transcriptional regulator [Kordiimonas sediminis]|uniref:Hg(II)-responsive transcriptional regulator n=1 Tax=Kordiimonas sediminis TaxID=1735581 RepID=A0A919E700_9PROT|nr:heavy metal-responsive transcriptional regulator [Kordiimonas sediminis]GHF19447.1 Hg(II)-responsive transcriptional regulator [Kordiimonas sediminis]